MSVKSIAEKAGVSPATVSNVIHGKGKVSQEVASRIMQLIKEEDYVPAARKRRGSASRKNIAFTTTDWTFGVNRQIFHSKLMDGVLSVLEKNNYSLLVHSATNAEKIGGQITDVEAVMLTGFSPHPERFVHAVKVPVVWLMRSRCGVSDLVHEDNQEISRIAATHLFNRGHRVIGYIEDEYYDTMTEKRLHLSYYMHSLGGKVVDVIGKNIFAQSNIDYVLDLDELRGLIKKLLSGRTKPTALFLPSDRLCASIYGILKEMGILPQKDIELLSVTCDNVNAYVGAMQPRPYVIDINIEALGRRAAECVLWRLANPEEPFVTTTVRPKFLDPEGNEV